MSINATLFGQVIWFALFVWFCMKFVWPPLTNALEERKQKIAEGLSAADRAARDLELAQEKASGDLREAKAKAAEIIEQLEAALEEFKCVEDVLAGNGDTESL